MAETSSNSTSPSVAGVAPRSRGRMRKGTQSCTECRRRKIRCSFISGAAVCTPCSGRGSRCVDQREQFFEPMQDPKPKLVQSKYQQDIRLSKSLEGAKDESSDFNLPISEGHDRAPIVSFLNTTEQISGQNLLVNAKPISDIRSHVVPASTSNSKATSLCETLRTALPSYNVINSTLSRNGAWWNSFRQKSHAIYDAPPESLLDFAMHAYTSSNPAELGLLVTAYARSSNENQDLYALVDRMIISDFAYLATLDGLECLILLAKSYTDIGQPRKAWFTWRRGMGVAQLMGLYRAGPDSAKHQRLWWAIYHGDRFTSLLLGLPYGFNDIYYTDIIESIPGSSVSPEHKLVLHCAIIAGKIIDRNISSAEPSFAKTMDLYDQMDTIAASMPDSWWHIPEDIPSARNEIDCLLERLLQQFFFFHVKLYLHLPFVPNAGENSARYMSKLACMDASRQIVRIFLILRTKVEGASLFDCKTSDFISFTAAVVLLTGLNNSTNLNIPKETQGDSTLIESAWKVYCTDEEDTGCNMASQCRKTLGMLGDIPGNDSGASGPPEESLEIRIPYFGAVVRKRVKRISESPLGSSGFNAHPQSLDTSITSNQTPPTTGSNSWSDLNEIEYVGIDLDWGMMGLNSFQTDNWNPTLDLYAMDIDQDWGTFPDF